MKVKFQVREKLYADGLGGIDNIYPADECEFWEWIGEDD